MPVGGRSGNGGSAGSAADHIAPAGPAADHSRRRRRRARRRKRARDCDDLGVSEPRRRYSDADDLTRIYLERESATFAGSWIDHERDEYHVAFTGDLDRHRRALADLVPDPSVLHLHQRRYTVAELSELRDRISDDRAALTETGVEIGGLFVRTDRGVVVSVVAADAKRAATVLRDRYGDAAVFSYFGVQLHRVESVPWRCHTNPDGGDDDAGLLTIHYATNSDYDFDHVEHSEDDTQVRVTVFERVPVFGHTDQGAARAATICLHAPIGHRPVFDGATGETRPKCDCDQDGRVKRGSYLGLEHHDLT